jgi:cytochrome c-type biogenesis protein CcmF
MVPTWNLSLVVATFALVTLGTFLTRGSILASVHAFAESLVGPMYLAFLAAVLVAGFGGVAWRSGRVVSGRTLEGVLSRDAAFLGNNLVLVAVAFVVLVGTMFPVAVEALTGRRITVGGPYFSETTVPLFLLLLFLMAAGVVLPWRRASADRVRSRLAGPAVACAAVIVALVAFGVRHPAALGAFGLAAAVIVANVAELIRGGASRLRGPRRRHTGGLVAHVGLALAAVAITASSAFGTQREVTLSRGESARIDGYALRYEGARVLREPHRDVVIADVSVRAGGDPAGRMAPSLNLYPGASQPIGTPAVRYGAVEDLYVSVVAFEGEGSLAAFRLYVNPGVGWLWVGGAVVVIGGALAAWPSPRRVAPPVHRADPAPSLERVG